MPSQEQIMQEDFMNNCAVRTGLSGVMGMGLGAMFGIAMGTFDTAVCSRNSVPWQKLRHQIRKKHGRSGHRRMMTQGAGLDGNPEVTKQTTRQVLKEMLRNTSSRSW